MTAATARNAAEIATINKSSKNVASNDSDAGLTLRQRETAQYVSDMILELRNLAKAVKLFKVMVPLEYAYYEAYSVANRVDVPNEEADRLRELAKLSEAANESIPDDY
ncbi:MAG: hypothetical protein KDK75_05655 [Alphaproteobacteria bacterium]|nr:hypothetical protein [Alphaproteobacteria bacterium]